MRLCLGLLICLAVLGISACGGSTRHTTTIKAVHPRVAKTLSAGGPERTLVTWWRYVQLGAIPAAVYSYNLHVVQVTGANLLVGALAGDKSLIEGLTPVVVGKEDTPAGRLLNVETAGGAGTPTHYIFIMKQIGGVWKIEYDSLTAAGISAFGGSQAQLYTSHSLTDAQITAAGAADAQRFAAASLPTKY